MEWNEAEKLLYGMDTSGAEMKTIIWNAIMSYNQKVDEIIGRCLAKHLCVESVDIDSVSGRLEADHYTDGSAYKIDGDEFVFIHKAKAECDGNEIMWRITYQQPEKGELH